MKSTAINNILIWVCFQLTGNSVIGKRQFTVDLVGIIRTVLKISLYGQ